MKKIIILMAAVFALSACDKTYTVSDFRADKDLMRKYVAKCNNGELDANSLVCSNAYKVRDTQEMDSLKK
ncbi:MULTISPECIES: EexN family lipoprotein [Rosenbergiella]|uniref:EexN family lipoprotein n=1 Tax=Rosenbergiella TaxID=1356488 RepID=UPI001BDA40B5|nr:MULTISPECIES: EexN family lipoprotein [Rosenbergiella]MBT0721819.1 EexN family lipoprotein [Rosenbergiella collisarenosi]